MPGSFLPAGNFANQCAAPRSGTDPSTGQPYADVQGSTLDENNWLRSWSNDLYLWYSEIIDRDPSLYATAEYFDLLKTTRTTNSGSPVDRFHFTYPTDEWRALSQSGSAPAYGAEWLIVQSSPPREIVVAYTQPNSPATSPAVNLARGATILEADGVDVVYANTQAEVDALNAAFFPSAAGETHDFLVQDLGSAGPRLITMQSEIITLDPVQYVKTIPTPMGNTGYLLFNDHIATAEQQLIDAIVQLRDALDGLGGTGVVDLVLDIRYNGGGFLGIASELAYMIAGPVPTAQRTFELLQFNDKHPSTDPVTGEPLQPLPFADTAIGYSATAGLSLPTLDLPRVFVLTGPNTCSASESIINSLRGVNVEVIQIGATTCGKPYGFYPTDNCGTTYFTIQFKGVNELGFGDYIDGFSPINTTSTAGELLPGCAVADDLAHALGDTLEQRLSAALQYQLNQSCPTATATTGQQILSVNEPLSVREGVMPKTASRLNRIL